MKILVGVSGGVDSAFAVKKLQLSGHTVEGAILKMHEYTELDAARSVCADLGIPLWEIDCTVSFNSIIKKNFVDEYAAGRTPNPCVLCNERVKFKYLYDFAMEKGFDGIATGHYAKVDSFEWEGKTRYALSCAEDVSKDQTYMLYRLPQHILEKLHLPLYEETKSEVRASAAEYGIGAADRKDSLEICFLPEGGHAEYVESVIGKCPEGDFIDTEGRVLGRHKGIVRYTVGQRKGLGISLGERAFVTAIDPICNTVTLSPTVKGSCEVYVTDMVYSGMPMPCEVTNRRFTAKLRYSRGAGECDAILYPDGTARLIFDSPVMAAPGQSAVLYDGGRVMCGGYISQGNRT